jgi:hypothetical protein
MLVMWRVDQHERRRGPANFSAGHHQSKVCRLYMPAAGIKAMVHSFTQAGLIAAQTHLNALNHFFG